MSGVRKVAHRNVLFDSVQVARQELVAHSDVLRVLCRWFDKSVSLIVAQSGKACVNFEHSWGDGVAVLRYFNEVFDETTKRPFVHPDTAPAAVHSADVINKLGTHRTSTVARTKHVQQRCDCRVPLQLVCNNYASHSQFVKC